MSQNPPRAGGGNSRKRIRAHSNPLNDDLRAPLTPSHVDWASHYPKKDFSDPNNRVTIADVGCGFGGLLVSLAPIFPDRLILGLEIRERVVEIDADRIKRIRAEAEKSPGSGPSDYQNISVVHTNIMKYAANYFQPGQLSKMFILFPDPHFKRSNYRRRVINQNFLSIYAYCIEIGGLLYTITDVKDLHDWMVKHLERHPLFERIPMESLKDDPCVEAMTNGTEEGQKVSRLGGSKYPAVFRRIARKPDNTLEEQKSN